MQIYKVGGAVRDRLLGRTVTDIDWVVVGATTEQMLALGYRPVGADFPVFLHPTTGEEYALARTERKSGRGYGGFVFHASPDVTLEQDLIRRDLTINAMAEDDDQQLFDPYGGQKDLEDRILRHVSPAFAEDPLRVLRVARFAARYAELGFTVAPETLALMRELSESGELEALTPERSWKEISRALMENQPNVFVQVLQDCGALNVLMPEVATVDLEPLAQAAHHEQPLTVRWACLVGGLGKAINERFKVPRDCQELAMLVGQYGEDGQRALELSAERLLELLHSFDVYRRPQRFEEFIKVGEMKSLGQAQGDYLRGAADAARGVAVKPLVEAGFTGQQLGEALKAERLKALQTYKATAT
ncbi:multifunctional CCA tRNA nucleotidyl transferase/2'3'-cyclic phosphodiesterase/2'nucleotidase/phosphatase [Pseudomonas sp. TE3610]